MKLISWKNIDHPSHFISRVARKKDMWAMLCICEWCNCKRLFNGQRLIIFGKQSAIFNLLMFTADLSIWAFIYT